MVADGTQEVLDTGYRLMVLLLSLWDNTKADLRLLRSNRNIMNAICYVLNVFMAIQILC
jgi:hypothetical protein